MPKFLWKGVNAAGKACNGTTIADSQDNLKVQLLNEGIALLSCNLQSNRRWRLSRKLTDYDFIDFFDQMAVLLDGGIDLLSAIRTIEPQVQNTLLRDVLSDLRQSLQSGQSLSQALIKHNKVFNEFIIQMIDVGLRSGNLGFVMAQIALYLRTQRQLKKDLVNAAIMPMFTIFFALLIVIIILTVVVPQFEIFFNSLGKQLPGATKRIIGISNFLRSRWGAYTLIAIFFGWLGVIGTLGRTRVKRFKDRIVLTLPYIKNLVELSNITHFLQALTILLNSGITMKDAIMCAQNSMNNVYLRERFSRIIDDIVRGKSLSNAVARLPSFYRQENLVALINVGEQTGGLANVLGKSTQAFQDELKRFVLIVTSLFQPVLLVVVGLIIGVLIWLIYLPIFNLAYSLN